MSRKKYSKALAVLLAFVMIFTGTMSSGFTAEAAAGESVRVTFSYSKENGIVYGPKELEVRAGLAASYNIGAPTEQPTVLDAVVTAHIDRYGDKFTQETASQYVDNSLGKLFEDSGFGGHIVNSHYSQDYASQAVLNNNDIVDVFLYSNDGMDSYASFYQNEDIVKHVTAETGTSVDLKVKGFNVMGAYGGEKWEPLENLTVGVLDVNSGNFVDKDVKTGVDGSLEITFDKEGEYILVAKNTAGTPAIIPAWCKVNVQKGLSPEEMTAQVAQDKAALDIKYTGGNSIDLPLSGASGKTKISWSSDKPEVISDTGRVVKQLTETTVKLTAAISIGSVKDTKEFVITVPALDEAGMDDMLSKAGSVLTKVKALDPVEYSGKSGGQYSYDSEVLDTNIITKAQGIVDKNAPGVKVSLKTVHSGNEFIGNDGEITYLSKEGNAEVTFVLSLGSKSIEKKIAGIKVPSHDDSKVEAVKALMDKTTLETVLNGQEQGKVTKTLKLPVGSSYGLGITWKSDHSAIRIDTGTSSSTGQLHKITRPALGEKDAEVTLTATFDYSEMAKNYGMCDGGPMPSDITKTFKVTVPAITKAEAEAIEIEVEEAVASVRAEGITAYDMQSGKDTKEPADLKNIIGDLHFYDFDRNNQFYKNGVRLTWSSTNPAIQVNTLRGKVTRPAGKENAVGKVTVTAAKEGITASKNFDTVVLASDVKPTVNPVMKSAINKITAGYASKDANWWGGKEATWWHASIMGADKVVNGRDLLSAEKKQAFANQMIEAANTQLKTPPSAESAESSRANALANAANGLSAMGFDINKLGTINGTSVELGNGLSDINIEGAKKGWFVTIAPYVYIAANQGEFHTDKLEADLIKYLMDGRKTDGSFSDTMWGVDSHAMVIQGLAMSSDPEVKEACEKGVEVLAGKFAEQSGNTFGSSNSDAMVVIALAAMGVNPDTDPRFVKDSGSLIDGLLSYLTTTGDGFALNKGGKYNDMATYQGTLALLAAKKVAETGQPANVFDFTSLPKVPVKVNNPGGSEELPKPPEEGKDITVNVTINSDTGTWLSSKSVTVKEGSTVGSAFVKALEGTGIKQEGAEAGYVKSMTYNGKTLAEFSKGPNSGWLYKVNGSLPDVGINSYTVKNGDSILFYYTDDWKKDPDAGNRPGMEEEKKPVSQDITASVSGKEASAKVPAADIDQLISDALKNKADIIDLNIKGADKVDKISVELPKVSVKNIADKTDAALHINTASGNVTLDRRAMTEAVKAAAGDEITLILEKKVVSDVQKVASDAQKAQLGDDAAFTDVKLLSGGKEITDLGTAKITVELPVSDTLAAKTCALAIMDADGKLTKLSGKVVTKDEKKYFRFETSVLGSFVLAEESKLDAAIKEQNEQPDHSKVIAGVKATTIKAKSVLNKYSVKLTWTKSKGYKVDGYQVYRSTKKDGKFKKIGETAKRTYLNSTGLKKGVRYYYKVRGVRSIGGKNYYTKWSNLANRKMKAASLDYSVKKVSVKAKAYATKGSVKVSWTKSKGCKVDGYQVYRADKKNGTYKKIATTKKASVKNMKNLKKGKTYYYKVRGYRTMEGKKVYTKWSSKVSAKVK